MNFFLDSSALVKRYLRETGTRTGFETSPTHPRETPSSSPRPPVSKWAAALAARHRVPDGISLEECDEAIALLLRHCDTEYRIAILSRAIVGRAVSLTQTHRLRGCDAVQLATALAVEDSLSAGDLPGSTFAAADEDLISAARAEGISAENPNDRR